MRLTREQYFRDRLRLTEIHLLKSLICNWVLGAALIITLAVVFDKMPG